MVRRSCAPQIALESRIRSEAEEESEEESVKLMIAHSRRERLLGPKRR